MKIAVTCDNDEVFQHFGSTPEFAIFEISEGKISGMMKVPTTGSGHGALADFLTEREVNLLICGGIGGCAQQALANAGITIVGGASGDVIQAVGNYLKGQLSNDPCFSCNHEHKAGEAHNCHCH